MENLWLNPLFEVWKCLEAVDYDGILCTRRSHAISIGSRCLLHVPSFGSIVLIDRLEMRGGPNKEMTDKKRHSTHSLNIVKIYGVFVFARRAERR